MTSTFQFLLKDGEFFQILNNGFKTHENDSLTGNHASQPRNDTGVQCSNSFFRQDLFEAIERVGVL